MARKPVPIDLDELEKLGALHCTQEEAADWFGIARETFNRKLRQKQYREVWERGRSKGRVTLRRRQMQGVEAGNPTMLIWMGKQWLGQRDTPADDDTRLAAFEEYLAMQKGERP